MSSIRILFLAVALLWMAGCHLALGLPVARLESQVPGWYVESNESVTAEKALAEWSGQTFRVSLILRVDDPRWALKVIVRTVTGGEECPGLSSGRLALGRAGGPAIGDGLIGSYEVTVDSRRTRAPFPLPLSWDEKVEIPPGGAAILYLSPEVFFPEFPPPDATVISFDLTFQVGGNVETARVRLKIVEIQRHPETYIQLG